MEMKTLKEAIAVESRLLTELLQVFERETIEMGDVNIDAMNNSNQEKEELIAKIINHAPLVKHALSELAVRQGLSPQATFKTIAESSAKRGSKELLACQQQLNSTAERIQQVAALNRDIAERFAFSVSTSLGLITRLINQSNVYGASGGYQQRPASAVMINREA
jgi:flagellar biosynthesis/type III secretory pathway chaperone